jgi:hypothetical protein
MKDIHFYFDDMLAEPDGVELRDDIMRLQKEFDDNEFNKTYLLVNEDLRNSDLKITRF